MTTTRIPRSAVEFDTFITNTNTYQAEGNPANYTRWGWTLVESAAWAAFVTTWTPLFTKYSAKKTARTTDVKNQVHQVIEAAVAYDHKQHLLDRVASSPNSNATDYATFNIKRGTPLAKAAVMHPQAPLADACHATVVALGGGDMRIGCRTTQHTGRPARAEGADCVRYFFKIGDPAPANTGDGTTIDTSTKASFTLHLGTANSGKKLYLYAQWYNSKHPTLAGPASSLVATTIA